KCSACSCSARADGPSGATTATASAAAIKETVRMIADPPNLLKGSNGHTAGRPRGRGPVARELDSCAGEQVTGNATFVAYNWPRGRLPGGRGPRGHRACKDLRRGDVVNSPFWPRETLQGFEEQRKLLAALATDF